MKLRGTVLSVVLGSALIVGCGEDEKAVPGAGKPASAEQAVTEIDAVSSGLDKALETYRSGDVEAADTQAGDAYLEHFELVEGPLEEKDAELKEELEDGIRDELRDKIKSEAPKREVADLVAELQAGLDEARSALR